MAPQPENSSARRFAFYSVAILVALVGLGFAGRWWFVRWIVSNAAVTINRARKSLAAEQTQPARHELAWLLWAAPQHPDALFLWGMILEAEEQVDEALTYFDRVPVNTNAHRQASSAAAFLCLTDRRLEIAERRLRQHLERYPDSPPLRDELRWLYFNQLRTRELETFLEQELEKNPADLSLAIELLNSEFRKQLPREGIGYLQEADARHPDQAPVKAAIGYCLWQIGRVEEARAGFERALELAPSETRIRQMAAEFLLEQGGQLEQVGELLEPQPADDNGWYLLSRWSEQKGDLAAAESHIRAALQRRPGELKYVQRRGELLRRLGQTQAADKALQAANELETVQTELSELVLRGRHEQPTVETCQQLAKWNRARQRHVQAQAWERAAKDFSTRPVRQRP